MKKLLIALIIICILGSVFVNLASAKTNRENKLFLQSRENSFLNKIIDFLKKIPFINKTINFFKNLFGLVENIENLPEYEYTEKNYNPYYQNADIGPGSQLPTDTSISVSINSFNLDYVDDENTFEFDMTFGGSTSGSVYGCYWILVNYFDDGTTAYSTIWMSPIQTEMNMEGYSIESTFIGTGSGGDNDWSSFRARQFVAGNSVDLEKIPFEITMPNQGKTLSDVRLYVRAFSDEDLTQWNQDSISVMNKMTGSVYESPKDKNEEADKGIPGFEIILLLAAFGVAIMLYKKRN